MYLYIINDLFELIYAPRNYGVLRFRGSKRKLLQVYPLGDFYREDDDVMRGITSAVPRGGVTAEVK